MTPKEEIEILVKILEHYEMAKITPDGFYYYSKNARHFRHQFSKVRINNKCFELLLNDILDINQGKIIIDTSYFINF